MSEKTEKPTAKRIRDARSEGQVAKSQEITAVVQLGTIFLWLVAEGRTLVAQIGDATKATIDATGMPLDDAVPTLIQVFSSLLIRFAAGMAVPVIVALTLTGLLQTGFVFSPKALKVSGERINPLSNIKQIVSMRSLFELFKSLIKVGVLGLTFIYLIMRYAASFAYLPTAGFAAGLVVCEQMAQWMWLILIGATIIFAVPDYMVQRRQLMKQLMMSKEDIKQEYKNSEGSPEVKHRRRELHREVQSGSLGGKVRRSSVIVRNPTRIAVCIRYVAGETPLPQVLAIERDALALRVVALAERENIPVVENIPLARALLASSRPGDYVPRDLFQAVAEVLRIVFDQIQEAKDEDDPD